jgi:hypothetical protein
MLFELIEFVRDKKTLRECQMELKKLIITLTFLGVGVYGEIVWDKEWLP